MKGKVQGVEKGAVPDDKAARRHRRSIQGGGEKKNKVKERTGLDLVPVDPSAAKRCPWLEKKRGNENRGVKLEWEGLEKGGQMRVCGCEKVREKTNNDKISAHFSKWLNHPKKRIRKRGVCGGGKLGVEQRVWGADADGVVHILGAVKPRGLQITIQKPNPKKKKQPRKGPLHSWVGRGEEDKLCLISYLKVRSTQHLFAACLTF